MSEWQDIATAPRDGTLMLIASVDGIIIGEWHPEKGCFVDSQELAPFWYPGIKTDEAPWATAKQWMPLPHNPAEETDR